MSQPIEKSALTVGSGFFPLSRFSFRGCQVVLAKFGSVHCMNERVATIICCPLCHGALRFERSQMRCDSCGAIYRIQTDVPVFVQEPLVVVSSDHRSNPIGADFEVILRDGKAPTRALFAQEVGEELADESRATRGARHDKPE